VDANVQKVTLVASGIKWTTPDLTVKAGEPFVISLDNQDAAVPHNIQIKDSAGTVVYTSDTFSGVETRDFTVKALPAGTYPFICTIHPAMTGTLTVK
jgi:plastocyanin